MKQNWMAGTMILACLMIGCRNESERLADMAEQTVEMQSKQNSTIAKSREEIVALNREIQMERTELNKGLNQLESGRRELHQERRSDLAWAESFQFLAIVIAASMPLFLCAYLIWAATRNGRDAELVNEVMIQELVTSKPKLIAGPNHPALKNGDNNLAIEPNRLPAPQTKVETQKEDS